MEVAVIELKGGPGDGVVWHGDVQLQDPVSIIPDRGWLFYILTDKWAGRLEQHVYHLNGEYHGLGLIVDARF
jgi:hypothetical protein